MLKSQARRRITTKAAAAGVLSAGLIFGAVPLIAAMAQEKTVTFTCAPSGGTASYALSIDLSASPLRVAPGKPVTLSWKIKQPTGTNVTPLPAISVISTNDKVVVIPTLVATPFPTPTATGAQTVAPSAVLSPATTAASGSPIPFPVTSAVATITPMASGTFSVTDTGFSLYVTTATSLGTAWYTCTPANSGVGAAPTVSVTVASTSPSPVDTSPTPTRTPTKSKTTHTVFKTVTKKPKSPSEQVTKKPGGGADTGGGGDAGPDGRTFVMVGTLLVLGAGAGGLLMRHRRPRRG